MIRVNTYRCPDGCERMSAAPLDQSRCCMHDAQWIKVSGSALDIRTQFDPRGTPLVRKAKES